MAESKWVSRSTFAEQAEALDVTTDCIMAGIEQDGFWWVLYTERPKVTGKDWIHFALLYRGPDRLLHINQQRRMVTVGDFHGDIEELMRKGTC